ncbi:MAG: hypothetical protein CM15mP122_2540 [Bacteroidota bacterium]|nr:MAG: hypothetical protein CM15mP122_2540 [Bacteroidota bacterium]
MFFSTYDEKIFNAFALITQSSIIHSRPSLFQNLILFFGTIFIQLNDVKIDFFNFNNVNGGIFANKKNEIFYFQFELPKSLARGLSNRGKKGYGPNKKKKKKDHNLNIINFFIR